MSQLTEIRTFLYRHDAEMAKELLEGQGIEVLLSIDDAGGTRPQLAYSGGAALLVKEEDSQKARDLLNQAFGEE
jgi:hypothetical protein